MWDNGPIRVGFRLEKEKRYNKWRIMEWDIILRVERIRILTTAKLSPPQIQFGLWKKTMETGCVRQFVKISDGRVGVVMANEMAGGVYRGHCDLWFGQFKKDGSPVVEQLCVAEDWVTIHCPLGMTKCELGKEQ